MKKLYQYTFGDLLPPFLQPDGSWVRPYALSITAEPVGFILTHSHGGTQFTAITQDVAFPVRMNDNGTRATPKNWCLSMEHPTPEQLAVNDILPPHGTPFDPRNDPDWDDMDTDERVEVLKEFWDMVNGAQLWQVVTSITPGELHNLAVVHTQQYSYDVTIGQPFKQPWQAKVALPKPQMPPLEAYPRSGTYRNRMTHKEAQFAIHHAGKGHYPSSIPTYDLEGEGFMRAPARSDFPKTPGNKTPYVDEWNWWELLGGGKRHPFDPRGKRDRQADRDAQRRDVPLDFYDDPNAG